MLDILTGIFLTEIVSYALFGALLGRGRVPQRPLKREPKVTIVIPTFNEGGNIKRKIKNVLSLDYPKEKLEVIFVDDSLDDTPKIIEVFTKKHKNFSLIHRKERGGQTSALNVGVERAKGEFVLLSDADSFMNKQAIRWALETFDEKTGAVFGRIKEIEGSGLANELNALSWKLRAVAQTAESRLGGAVPVLPPITMVRKKAWTPIENWIIANDVAIALSVKRNGYDVVCNPRLESVLRNPATLRTIAKQRRQHVGGGIKTLWHYKDMLFNPKYGIFALTVLPRYFYHTVLKQFVVLGILIGLLYNLAVNPAGAVYYALLLFYGITLANVLLGLALVVKMHEDVKYLGYAALRVFFQAFMVLSNLMATAQLSKFSVKWDKAK